MSFQCDNVDFTFSTGRFYLNRSCVRQSLSSGSYNVSNFVTGVNRFSYSRDNSSSTYLSVCECNSNIESSCHELYWSTANTPNIVDLNPNKYYRIAYRPNDFTSINFQDCIYIDNRSEILKMSEELALGSGNSLFSNLNQLTPLFIVLIGFILGYWFLRKIIKKGQKGGTL